MDPQFRLHEVAWTAEKSSRWWDAVLSLPGMDRLYFSRMVGADLINFLISARVSIEGRVVDFGCGPGYLLEQLLLRGIACEGADFSAKSVETAVKRLSREKRFGGVALVKQIPTHLPADTFDTLFLVETIEHILEDQLAGVMAELKRVIKPGGIIIVTTPNDETLEEAKTVCPDCGCVYHRVQHVRSWTAATLASFMAASGFKPTLCRAVYLQPTRLRRKLAAVAARLMGKKLPHLVLVGRKRTDGR